MNVHKALLTMLFAGVTVAPGGALAVDKGAAIALKLPVQGEMASLSGATGWLNSPPLTTAGLRGKVVLIDFWTYTCINWLRTEPYVRAWAEKYKNQGLVVIGVHTPEFAFEHNVDNVRRAVQDMQIEYPVAIDSEYAIWNAFANRYWPALYFIDSQGRIRHHQFGEGDYEQSETVIQQLLSEGGSGTVSRDLVSVEARGAEVAADWGNLKSPENYIGFERTENFSSPGRAILGQPHIYAIPARLKLNDWALSGDWTMENPFTILNRPTGANCLPLSCPRPSSGHGAGGGRSGCKVSRARRRSAAGRRSRDRCRRQGQWHGDRAAPASANSPKEARCRSDI